MTDYIVTYKLNNKIKDKVFTIEDDVYYIMPDKKDMDQDVEFEINQTIEEILTEQLKDYLESEAFELIDFIPVNVQDNLYRFTEDDIYFDKETYI
jgi:hypothetical protein